MTCESKDVKYVITFAGYNEYYIGDKGGSRTGAPGVRPPV